MKVKDLKKCGLSNADIDFIVGIHENAIKMDNIIDLIIRSHNYGFKKGVEQSVKFIECQNSGEDYDRLK